MASTEPSPVGRPLLSGRTRQLVLLCFLALAAGPALGAAVSPGDQALNFARAFRFDPRLASLQEPSVLLVSPGGPAPALDELAGALSDEGFAARVVSDAGLPEAIADAAVLYLRADTATPEALALAQEAGVLTISGDGQLVREGRAALGLEDLDGTVRIVVHRGRLALEGHSFSAQLLKLATIVGSSAVSSQEQEIPSSDAPGIEPPALLSFDAPRYPRLARRARIEGVVVVRLLISVEGKVDEAVVIQEIAEGLGTSEAAIAAARSAIFRPATRDGQPIAVWHALRVPFRLQG